MPNWCSNSIVIIGDKDRIKKIKRVLQSMDTKNDKVGVFQTLIGRDERLSEADYQGGAWYQSNIDRFGCKWDVDYDTCNFDLESDDCITMSPETAWSPPEEFCRLLSQQYGVDVQLEYSEPGSNFAGRITIKADGDEDTEQYEYLEGLYHIDNDYFWMELRSNLEYEFEEDEPREFEEWFESFGYIDKSEKPEFLELYEDIKKEYQEQN